ncbi:hypothetical protein [Phyllobacterium zundukense]|uniref:Uncharacterized protein n=1 Tax=Phyllobacterium zundukense TaxID=1867719 RepID=A0A2N9W4F2_9HYPH|nr:hypothetical protein [Phyllobacterium zundukense]ATU91911.1 hypothetical protein BLM14_09955 [Phyllobacterium zundukense]PIO46620.1 hypothetical protein B5P45_02125 [Phyllobacterium zundukense]
MYQANLVRSKAAQQRGAAPWAVADLYRAQLKGIIGIEIEIAAIEGEWKVSTGVADGHEAAQHTAEARAMAEMVRGGEVWLHLVTTPDRAVKIGTAIHNLFKIKDYSKSSSTRDCCGLEFHLHLSIRNRLEVISVI